MPTEQLRVEIRLRDFVTNQLKRSAGAIRRFAITTANRFRAIGRAVLSLRGLLVGLGAGLLAKSFISAGSAMEKFRVQLNAVLGQNKALAEQTLKWVRDFAAATPFTTKAVIESFVTMKAAGIDATKEMLSTIGDVAFVFDQNISDLSIALVSMEKEVFKRLGVGWDIVGEKATITLGGMKKETAKTREAMRKGILELWTKQFPGAMKEAEKTWSGLVALMQSQWFEFQADIMDAGVFDFIKEGLKVAGQEFKAMAANPKETANTIIDLMEFVAKSIAAVADGVRVLKIVFIALGIGVNAVMVGISVVIQKMLQGVAGLFSLVQDVLNKIENSGGLVAKALEKAIGKENLGKLKEGLRGMELSVARFAEAGSGVINEYKENIKLATAELQHLRQESRVEEVEQLFARVRAGVKVKEDLRLLVDEFVRLRQAQNEALSGMDFSRIGQLQLKSNELQKRFAKFGEAGAAALNLAQQKALLLKGEMQKAAEATKKVAENSAAIVPGGVVELAEAATAAIGPAMLFQQSLMETGDLWEQIQEEARKTEEAYQDVFNAAKLKEANEALKEWEENFRAVKDQAVAVGSIMVNNIMRSIDAAEKGTFRWKKALIDTTKELGRMLLRQALMAAVQFGAGQLAGVATRPPAVPATGRGGVVLGGIGFPSAQTGMVVRGPTPLLAGDDRSGVGEGVFPLRKTRGGELGVQAVGAQAPPVQVIFNVNTIDERGVEGWLFENRHKMADMTGLSRQEGRTGKSSF